MYKQTTQVPNIILDQYLRILNASELKILLVIIRQTYGWIDRNTGKRKQRDRISQSQFKVKTGLCAKAISKAIQSLVSKGLIAISDRSGNLLHTTLERKGHPRLYFNIRLAYFLPLTSVQSSLGLVYKSAIDKTNYTKLKKTKLRERTGAMKSVGEVIDNMEIPLSQSAV